MTTWTFLTPVLGIALAAVVLGERPSGWTAVGLLAVLAAMWITLRPPRRTHADREKPRRTTTVEGAQTPRPDDLVERQLVAGAPT